MQYPRFCPGGRTRTPLVISLAVSLIAAAGIAHAGAVSPVPDPAPSFNGSIYAIAKLGDIVYVGGSFTGAVVGGRVIARRHLAAFSAGSGALSAWNPGADQTVRALAATTTTIYAAGDFTVIGGAARKTIAGLNPVSGAPTASNHTVTGSMNTLTVNGDRLYAGGKFTAVDKIRRANVAAFSLATGALTSWAPTTDNTVTAIAVSGRRVYLGGTFRQTDSVAAAARLAAVDITTGALDRKFAARPVSSVFGLAVDARGVVAAQGGQGGQAVAYTGTGAVRWTRIFDGDAQAVTLLDGVAYVGGHFDKACATSAARCPGATVVRRKLAAIDATGVLLGWAPAANGVVGIRSLVADTGMKTVRAGGDFTTVDALSRKRYAAFSAARPPDPAPATGAVASYDFDADRADSIVLDGSGRGHDLQPVGTEAGLVTSTPHGTGRAVVFPALCPGSPCPRVVLLAAAKDDLNPAARDFRYGATVRLAADQTSTGQNVLQKGYSETGSQYKLQIDKAAGRPSCVLVGSGTTTVWMVKQKTSVADGTWHRLECRRSGTSLTILADGIVTGTAILPADLTVTNTAPLMLGGKGRSADNDQYHGALDDAWIAMR